MSSEGSAPELDSHAARLRRAQERVAKYMSGPRFSVDAFLAQCHAQGMVENLRDASAVAAYLERKNRRQDHG